jgi:hypothetical protein
LQSDACVSPVESAREKERRGRSARKREGERGEMRAGRKRARGIEKERVGGGDAREDEREGRSSKDQERSEGSRTGGRRW